MISVESMASFIKSSITSSRCSSDFLILFKLPFVTGCFANEGGSLALITGESIGQVASQTIHNLAITNEVCNMPVFRPCIGMDKQEIVDIAEKIGTFESSMFCQIRDLF